MLLLLEREKKRVDQYLDSILPAEALAQAGLPQRNDNLKTFSAALRYAVFSGGKRIRPILLLHAYRLCGGGGLPQDKTDYLPEATLERDKKRRRLSSHCTTQSMSDAVAAQSDLALRGVPSLSHCGVASRTMCRRGHTPLVVPCTDIKSGTPNSQFYPVVTPGGNKALPAAAACELIHTFSLIQDDLPSMDNDDLRRGKPTLHRAYPEYTALLASDYLLILAFRQLIENYPAEISLAAIDAIGLDGLTAGQFLDLTHLAKNPTVKILEEIRQKKTAALFELVFKLGAMIAGAKAGRVRLMAEYGRDFGMAFQIRDDLADAEKVEPMPVMKKSIAFLVGRMQKIEQELKISSPILDYFRKFLQEK